MVAKKFPELLKDTNTQIQGDKQILKRVNKKKSTPSPNIDKLRNMRKKKMFLIMKDELLQRNHSHSDNQLFKSNKSTQKSK